MKEYLKARSIVEGNNIKLVSYSLAPSRPLFIFLINDSINVIYNHKGWVCDYLAKEIKPGKVKTWSCALNKGKICYHIIAAQLYIHKLNLYQEWMVGEDFKYVQFAKRSRQLSNHPLSDNDEE